MDIVRICSNCYRDFLNKEEKVCKVCNSEIVEIDYGFEDLIVSIWKKNIKTLFCCQGYHYRGESYVNEQIKPPYISLLLNFNRLNKIIKYLHEENLIENSIVVELNFKSVNSNEENIHVIFRGNANIRLYNREKALMYCNEFKQIIYKILEII